MNKHNARSLAKYLGMEVFLIWEDHRGSAILYSANKNNEVILLEDPNRPHKTRCDLSMEFIDVYPILKTSFGDQNFRHPFFELILSNHGEHLDEHNIAKLCSKRSDKEIPKWLLGEMMDQMVGAVEYEKSPTGYVSIHDNLPCIRWREDGRYSL